jgi:uncharacterized protein YndB with AHSA1/START domain
MTVEQKPQTEIELDSKVPAVHIIREFDAPVEDLYRAHVEAELFAQWIGPRGLEMRIDRFDCRTGGNYRYVHAQGDEEYWFYGSFHEVRPNELIVQTFTYEGMPDSVSLERCVFEDLGNGRSRLVATSLLDSFEARDGMVASGMEVGITEGYEKLDELLADL